ncbi:Cse1-domain-containing protein [Sanghuangporus baumii]|uniref:Cse1-domain-containing protein n=1 Tax=Sanghuangporus baumii TaxID=108892 RepID=A0A9Q5HWI3_SANBA|nr:Cse1-domain-containing protein [Sanghuangporus baumii]
MDPRHQLQLRITVTSFACHIRIFTRRHSRFNQEDIREPEVAPQILNAILSRVESDWSVEEIAENDYLMKCVMRVILTARTTLVPLIKIFCNARRSRENRTRPVCRFIVATSPGSLLTFEKTLFGLFTIILHLQQDIDQFTLRVFRIILQMLELHRGGIPADHRSLLPFLLQPSSWAQKGNVEGLTPDFLIRAIEACSLSGKDDKLLEEARDTVSELPAIERRSLFRLSGVLAVSPACSNGILELRQSGNKEFPEHERILPLAFDEENRLENHLVQSQGRILVMEHYHHLRDRIISIENLGLDQSVLLTGQPGVGKTTWLWFMLIYLLILKKNVSLYTKERTYLFYRDRVYIASSGPNVTWPPSTAVGDRIWCLIDSDERGGPPPSYLTSEDEGRIFPRSAVMIDMPLWNEEEIIEGFQLHQSHEKLLGLLKQEPSDTAIEKIRKLMVDKAMDKESAIRELIKETVKQYGSVPRDVYSAIINEEHHKRMLTNAINALSYEVLSKTLEVIKSPSQKQSPSTPVSHKLFVIHVEWSSGRGPDTFIPGSRSEHISRMMIEKLGHLTHVQAKRLFREFRWHSESSALAGWIFEGLAHGVLQGSGLDRSLAGPLLRMMKLRTVEAKSNNTSALHKERDKLLAEKASGQSSVALHCRRNTSRSKAAATEKLWAELQNPGADAAEIAPRHAKELRVLEPRLIAKHEEEELKAAIERTRKEEHEQALKAATERGMMVSATKLEWKYGMLQKALANVKHLEAQIKGPSSTSSTRGDIVLHLTLYKTSNTQKRKSKKRLLCR